MARLPYASAADRQAADAFFQKRGTARTLFEALQRTVAAIGKHSITATRSRVAFVARTKFLWVHEANDDGSIWVAFLLPHDVGHVRARSGKTGSRYSVHTKVRGIEDMDTWLVQLIEEAYAFDLKGPARPTRLARPSPKAANRKARTRAAPGKARRPTTARKAAKRPKAGRRSPRRARTAKA